MSIALFDKWGQRFNFKQHVTTPDEKPYVSGGMCEIRGRSQRPTLLNGQVIEFSGKNYKTETGFVLEHKKRRGELGDTFKIIRSSTGKITIVGEDMMIRALPADENLLAAKKIAGVSHE